jgi:hypothetical protein
MYLSTHLIVPYFITASGEIKRPEHLIAWWSRIFSFLFVCVPDDKDRIELRYLCRLFRDALKPPPLYTTFPHPNYPTLNELMYHLNGMHAALPDIIWEECSAPGTLVCVGMKVRAKYVDDEYSDDDDDTDDEFDNATIRKVNDDQTCDVVFNDDDHDPRKNVPLNEIQMQMQNVSVQLLYSDIVIDLFLCNVNEFV